MKILKALICISIVLFFVTNATSGMNLSENANLLLNGHLSGEVLKTTDHNFLKAHISIINSTYFAWSSAVLVGIYGVLSLFCNKK